MISKIGIIGAGSMGTALAQNVSHRVKEVILYARKQEIVESINNDRHNNYYFPNLLLNPNIHASLITNELDLIDFDAIIIAVPSSEVRNLVNVLSNKLTGKKIITVSKGLEYPSLKTMSEIISDELNNSSIGCLSGPNFADEIAYGHFAGITIGCNNPSFKVMASYLFGGFILDFSNDIRAVELCGVLKNVYAIGTGMWDSVYSSNNEHYTFLNMCYKEMCVFLKSMSYDTDILTKFCCFGDFNLTACVDKSRNRTLGLMVGKKIIRVPYDEKGIVFEGQKSVKGIIQLAHKKRIEVPIAEYVCDALDGKCDIARDMYTRICNQDLR